MKYIFLVLIYIMSLSGAHLNLGYGSEAMNQFNKKDTRIALVVWIEEIMRDNEHTLSFDFYNDSSLMAKELKNGKLDIVVDSALSFVKYFDKSDLASGFSGGMSNRKSENLVMVVHKDSSKARFLSLKEPLISIQDSEELGKLYAKYYFLKNSKDVQIQFIDTRKRNIALLKVFFKNTDAAIVTQKTFEFAKELNPQIGKRLQIIEYTNLSAGSFGFFSSKVKPELRKEITKIAKNVTKNVRGKQVLNIFQTDAVIETRVEELAPIEIFYNEYNKLKKR